MMKKYKKIYVEISNVCNLDCNFCPKTKRKNEVMSAERFSIIAEKISKFTDYVYLHVMGEPLLHPMLKEILDICEGQGLKVCITTNGTLLKEKRCILLNSKAVHKISISLHSFEGNESVKGMEEYIQDIVDYTKMASKAGQICSLRLWNINGGNSENVNIINMLEGSYALEKGYILNDIKNKSSFTLGERIYLQMAEKFDWPDMDVETIGDKGFCYGLRDQIAILVNGTVVPCCLDHEGDIDLGNIFEDDLENILDGDRAQKIYKGFSERKVIEKLCTKCGYRKRF